MSKHISQSDLSNIYAKEVRKNGVRSIEELLQENKREANYDISNSVFLSHSHLDKTVVKKMAVLFKALQTSVYVDWEDVSMPEITDQVTASTIKHKIQHCKKFLFLATYNALRSKWCNWELGLAYATRNELDFAIMPIETKTGKWTGNEYLALYPEVSFEGGFEDIEPSRINVSLVGGERIDFLNWLNRS